MVDAPGKSDGIPGRRLVLSGNHEDLAKARSLDEPSAYLCSGHFASADGGESSNLSRGVVCSRAGNRILGGSRTGAVPRQSSWPSDAELFLFWWDWCSCQPVACSHGTGSKSGMKRPDRCRPTIPPTFFSLYWTRCGLITLSLYGYQRSTSATLERLAKRGILFESARANAPWTLASHASFFTGRWPHELDVRWMTPFARGFPDTGRIPRISRLRDRGLRCQRPLLLLRHRLEPRLYSLRRLRVGDAQPSSNVGTR